MYNSAAVLNDSEVRTLPPIVAGGLHAPAGNSPVARYVTGLPQDSTFNSGGKFKLSSDLMHGSTIYEADKSAATMQVSGKQPPSRGAPSSAPPRNKPLNASTAAAIMFNDTSVSALLNQKLVASNVDLGPALQASPAVLVRHADPNAAARVAMLARSRQLQQEDSSGMKRAAAMARARQPQQPAVQATTMNVAALRLDTKTPPTLPAAAASSQHRLPYSPGPSQPVSGKSGVQVSVTPQLLNVNLAASVPAAQLPPTPANQIDDASSSELTPRRAAARAGSSSNGSRKLTSSASQTRSKLAQESSAQQQQQQVGGSLEGDAKLLFALIREQDKAATAAGRGRPGSTYVAVPLKRRQAQASGKSTSSTGSKDGQVPNAAASSQANNGMDPEMVALDGNIGMIRDYLALLNKFGPLSFLIYRGKTLRTTPDFQQFAHDQASCWPEVSACLDRLEEVLARHGVPLAVVAGAKLANLARTALGPSARRLPDLLDCLENLGQVAVQVQFPGAAPPRGDTARVVRRKAAIRVQTAMRGLAERRRFVARLASERAARVIETCARGMLGRWRGRLLHHMRRASVARARTLLKNRLVSQWAASEQVRDAAQPPEGQGFSSTGGGASSASSSSFRCWPAGRVEVHVPSLSLSESLRLMASPFPHMQAHDGGVSRIARLRDSSLAHLVLVLPALVPDDVLDYWCGLVRVAGGKERSAAESRPGGLRRANSKNADPRARVTVVVPEMSAYFAPHMSLADALLLSPQALNRIRNLVDRHAGVSSSHSSASANEEMEGLDSPEASAEDALAASEEPPVGTSWLHGGADGARIAAEPFERCRATYNRAAYLLPGIIDKASSTPGGKWTRSCTSEELLAVELGLPLVAATTQGGEQQEKGAAALSVKSRSGSKSVFVEAGCRVAIGAHAIKTQDDLVIALVKLIAANLDVEEWVLRCEDDLPGGAALGVARFQAAALPEVHRLRQERAQLLKQSSSRNTSSAGGGSSFRAGSAGGLTGGGGEGVQPSWGSAEMQLKVRARLLPDLRQHLPGQIQLARPDVFPRGWLDYLNFFLKQSGVVEAEPPSLCGRVSAHLFLAPHFAKGALNASSQDGAEEPSTTPQGGDDKMSSAYSSSGGGIAVESTQEVITSKHGVALAAAHPQRCISPQALERAARAVGARLLSRGVIGHVSVSFAVFREAFSVNSDKSSARSGTTTSSSTPQGGQLRMWGESIEPWLTPAAQAHAACALLASSGPPPNSNEMGLYLDKSMNELPTPYSQSSPYPMNTPMYSPLASFDQSANQNNALPSSTYSSTSAFHHPFPSARAEEAQGRAISSSSSSGVGTPAGLAYVTTTGALLHPGLAQLGPGGFDSLLRLARLHHRVFDRTTGAGDAFWPCDALIGGAVGFASLAPRSNERAAAKGFHGLVNGFMAKQVGTRTHAVMASLGAEAAQEAANGGDPDGYGSMVRMETVAKDAHVRFEKRLLDQRAAKQKAIDDAKAAKEQEANLAAAAKRRAEKASMNKGRNTPKSRSGRRH